MRITLYISGTLAAVAIIFGSLFKILHYPGGNELYAVAAAILGFIYVPLSAIQLYRRRTMKKWGVLHLEGVGHLANSRTTL